MSRPSTSVVVIALLLALLPVLAVFQYRWLGRVSEAERERLSRSLSASAADFRRAFDRELALAYTSLSMDHEIASKEDWERYAMQVDQWSAAALYPSLVRSVYYVQRPEEDDSVVRRFDRSSRAFVACEPDAQLERLREALAASNPTRAGVRVRAISVPDRAGIVTQSSTTSSPQPPMIPRSESPAESPRGPSGKTSGALPKPLTTFVEPLKVRAFGPVVLDLPALVIPVERVEMHRFSAAAGADAAIFMTGAPSEDFVVAVLDRDVIVGEMIPALVARHFGAGGSVDFDVAVLDGPERSRLVYTTDAALDAAAYGASEVTEQFFTITPDELREVGPLRVPFSGGDATAVSRRMSHFELKVVGTTEATPADRIFVTSTPEAWQVAVRHKAGSLDAAVDAVRRRNIALSFGIFLLLGVSVVMLVVSSQRAKRLARRQMEFVAGVSHELRTPLTVICSAAENLSHGVVASERQVKQYGALIEGEGRRLAEMVEQVLEYAGAESGKTRFSLRRVDAGEIVREAVRASEALLVESGIRVEVEIAERLPAVDGDPSALRRALQNLLVNASKYAADGGVVSVSARDSGELGAKYVLLAVRDRGPGIDPADLPHVFEPFFRGRAAVDAQIHGSGLGLNLVKRVAEAHGGSVRVESERGFGSTFTIKLPVAAGARRDEAVSGRSYEQAHPTR